ncbi:hypothetical protein Vadar_009978 [Vaccinium darrowii]|uniref:Uncharacterized protein n=1 Tax=Vaccinium darrowii TaxID=229202 RepID=A0ACB7ZBL8_9ERIC|nr:hypothetical protein Vadar_009978 [Vaccinium darrowii]
MHLGPKIFKLIMITLLKPIYNFQIQFPWAFEASLNRMLAGEATMNFLTDLKQSNTLPSSKEAENTATLCTSSTIGTPCNGSCH